MDESKYSTPVPVIGLYIAGASLVCLLLLVYDIVHAFRSRKPWIPCRFFTLNSFTLTVLAIATKIPVDLTTPMPSAHDQLAKICGTILLCISMGFFFPSVGDMSVFESVVNVASLFIMVVTVVVNICIQIATGLIHLFVVEHIMVLAVMLLLLYFLSVSNFKINFYLKENNKFFKEVLKENYRPIDVTGVSREFYKCSYINNPQVVKCKGAHYPTVGIFCLILLLILIEVATRALGFHVLNSYQRVSDYKWSMWMVVRTQIFTIIVIGVAIAFRWLVLVGHSDSLNFQVWGKRDSKGYKSMTSFVTFFKVYSLPSCLSRVYVLQILQELQNLISYVRFMMEIGWGWTDTVVVSFVSKLIAKHRSFKENNDKDVHAYTSFNLNDDEVLASWLLRKSKENIKKWIEKCRVDPSSHPLRVLASDCDHSIQLPSVIQGIEPCGFLVVLVLVANVVMPPERRFLVDALDEVFEIIYFVEERKERQKQQHREEQQHNSELFAREIWMSRKISNHWFHDDFIKPLQKKLNMKNITSPQDLAYALEILGQENTIPSGFHLNKIITTLANEMRATESMEELYKVMGQLFFGVLTQVLDKLPHILVDYIFESSYKDAEERTKLSLKFLRKLNLIGVPWSRLTKGNIIGYMTNSASMEGEDVPAANVTNM